MAKPSIELVNVVREADRRLRQHVIDYFEAFAILVEEQLLKEIKLPARLFTKKITEYTSEALSCWR
ncbi:MAG: hypothetical protein ABI813_15745 [Bacteroidota bacterium]